MIRGIVELLSSRQASGWATDDSAPDEQLNVRILLEGREIAATAAEIFRQDLKDAGMGNGRHGFVAVFPDRISDEARIALQVQASDALGRTKLLDLRRGIAPLRFAPTQDCESVPLFILGSPRSGTSAIAVALSTSTRYEGYNEGHVIPLLPTLLSTISDYYQRFSGALEQQTMLATVPQAYVEGKLDQVFIDLARSRFDTPYWMDKTPSNLMILAAPRLAALWPRARFVFMKRRGIENVASRVRKFDTSFERHCRDWADAMLFWTQVRERLGTSALEIDQLTMARQPDATAAELAQFLGLNSKEADILRQNLAAVRPEQTGNSIDLTMSLEGTGWSPHEISVFRQVCEPMMRAYGYGDGIEYFSNHH